MIDYKLYAIPIHNQSTRNEYSICKMLDKYNVQYYVWEDDKDKRIADLTHDMEWMQNAIIERNACIVKLEQALADANDAKHGYRNDYLVLITRIAELEQALPKEKFICNCGACHDCKDRRIAQLEEALRRFTDNSTVQTNHPTECEEAQKALEESNG